jgi:hypothetical protein
MVKSTVVTDDNNFACYTQAGSSPFERGSLEGIMHALISRELAEQRRQDLLRQAERARRVRKARRARSARAGRGATPAWRAAAGRVLVRAGVLASGTALEDSLVVVRHRRRPATIAVIWAGRGLPPADPPAPTPLPAGHGDRSGSRS